MRILRALHTISSDTTLTFDDKLQRLLNVGCELLSLELGVISEVSGEKYTVIAASTPEHSLRPGRVFHLNDTFCKDTLAKGEIVSYHNVDLVCKNHPAAKKFQLYVYIGIPLIVDGQLFGTVNFASTTARTYPFKEVELDYIILLAEWIGTELSRKNAFESVTKQKNALQKQNEMLNQVGELAGVGTWEIDVKENGIFWSEALKKLYEFPQDFDVSFDAGMQIIRHESEKQRIKALINKCIETGEPISTQLEVITAKGKAIWIAIRGQAEFENGECVKILGATQDITRQVRDSKDLEHKRQVAEQALQARSQFLANMSHEIRTPINGVLGMLDTLFNTNLNKRQRELCSIAQQSAESLLGLINDILDFSKIDSGEMTLEMVPLNLSDLIENQAKIFELVAKKKGLELHTDLSAIKGLQFKGDPTRIQQILTNLINNAIKFTHRGSVNIHTRALKKTDQAYLIHLIVKDTGVGIDQSRQSQIFSPFQQGDSATTREFGGTGLGLTIVAQIAEMMGGGIRVESEPGVGSTFTVTLQLAQTDERGIEPLRAETVSQGKLSFTGYHILVVEDNAINQIVITEQLKELKVNIELAENGEVAVNKVKAKRGEGQFYDLIFMDCQMPVMDGYTAATMIRELGVDTNCTPIIALTANVLVGEREKCVKAGMNDYLTKPINVRQLGACLQRYLTHKDNKSGD